MKLIYHTDGKIEPVGKLTFPLLEGLHPVLNPLFTSPGNLSPSYHGIEWDELTIGDLRMILMDVTNTIQDVCRRDWVTDSQENIISYGTSKVRVTRYAIPDEDDPKKQKGRSPWVIGTKSLLELVEYFTTEEVEDRKKLFKPRQVKTVDPYLIFLGYECYWGWKKGWKIEED